MTIERVSEWEYLLCCDICGATEPANSFDEARDTTRRDGWKTRNVKGEWEYVCPECQRMEEEMS